MKKEKDNFGFIAASSICIFILLIMIVGNFGGKGTRAADGSIKFGDYTCADDSGAEPMDGRESKCGKCEGTTCYRCSCSENAIMTEDGCKQDLINVLGGCVKVGSGASSENAKTEVDVPTCGDSVYTGELIDLTNKFSSKTNISVLPALRKEVGSYDISITVSDTSKYVFKSGSTSATVTCKIVKNSASGDKTVISKPTCSSALYTGSEIDLANNVSNSNGYFEVTSNKKTNVGIYSVNVKIKDTSKYSFLDGSTTTDVQCSIINESCSISFTNGKSEIETGKSFTVTANVTPVSGAKVSKYSWSVSSNNVSITSGSSSQLATFKAGSSVGNATITLTATLDNEKTCSNSFTTKVVASTGSSSSSSNVGSKLTVSFKNGDDVVETKTCTVTSNTLGCVGVVTPAAPQAKDGYRFNGWGTSKGCTSGVFAANYAMSSITKNMTYYACFVEDNDEVDDSYTVDKCSFSGPYTVSSLVPDYEGCKHYGVYYDGKQEFAYVKQCCIDKGYVWVGENFSTAKSAYCITCSSDDGGNNGGNNGGNAGGNNDGVGGGDDTGNNNGGNNNATNNPPTGSALIFVVWSIGIAMVVYAFWYFKTSKEY